MRYGENPHQSAAFYREAASRRRPAGRLDAAAGQGARYNNIADADAAWECVKTFTDSAAPASSSSTPTPAAWPSARRPARPTPRRCKTDPTSAFGGIIAFNAPLDGAAAEHGGQAVRRGASSRPPSRPRRAPSSRPSRTCACSKCRCRRGHATRSTSSASAAACCCSRPTRRTCRRGELRVVTKQAPSAAQLDDLLFAWKVAKFVKSNAIVFCAGGMTLGVGAGQMSRIDSARIAVDQGRERRPDAGRLGGRQRRLLPVPRRPGRGRRCRRQPA